MTHSLRRRITTRLFSCAAILMLAAGSSNAVAQDETPVEELPECPRGWKLETVEVDVFAPNDERGLKTFGAFDLSTAVITNSGASPARVTITYYYEDCLCLSNSSDNLQCEVLEQQTADIYPGDQSISILNFSPTSFGDERRRIAYRVLVESMSHYGDLFTKETAQQDKETRDKVNYQLMEVYVDFYQNLKMVDCRNTNGTPDFSDEERRQASIQSVKFTNFVIPLVEKRDNETPVVSSGLQMIRPTDRPTEDTCKISPPAEAQEPGDTRRPRSRMENTSLEPVKISPPRPTADPNSQEILNGGVLSDRLQGGYND